MRSLVLGCAILSVAGSTIGCSRRPPSSEARPPAAAGSVESAPAAAWTVTSPASETAIASATGPTLRLAAALEGTAAAGAAELVAPSPSLTGKTVLHVGDSMVGGDRGLTRALEQRFTAEGAKFIRDYKVSESIVSYDHSPKLKGLLAKHQPDIVIVTLGTNDVFVPYPASMTGHIQNIVKRIGARDCYWMGPPTWKPDTGIVRVLKDNVAPCKFFDSSSLKLQRAGDGIHPTDRGGAEWATSFWTFFRGAPTAMTARSD